MTYAKAGVNYGDVDPVKILAQKLASSTDYLTRGTADLLGSFRGESAAVFRLPNGDHMAHVEEGLGTKILLAEAVYKATGNPEGFRAVAIDTAAMIFNDIATVGIPPVSMQMHIAGGHGDWFKDRIAMEEIMRGWQNACLQAKACWSGGETPILKNVVYPNTAVMAGSAVGILQAPQVPIMENIQPGDVIIGLASSGVHANAITLLREIGEANPKHRISLFEDALKPTTIYVGAVRELLARNIRPHYAIHVTGHGWRKLMRAKCPFTYVIDTVPRTPLVFKKIQTLGNVTKREMWGNYNMGIGFVFITSPLNVKPTMAACRAAGYTPYRLGVVKMGPKMVRIKPVGLVFREDSLNIR